MSHDHDMIDAYLDDLLAELLCSQRAARRALTEAEDHLRQAADEARSAGFSEEDAQRAAIERFGPPRLVARRFGQAEEELSILARPTLAALQVAGIGLTAIGFSGLIVVAMTLFLGASYVLGFEPSRMSVGPPEYYRELLDQYPSAGTCPLAYQQSVLVGDLMARFVPGAVGILMLGGLWLVSWRWTGRRSPAPSGASTSQG